MLTKVPHSDILHPNRANISKEELREKLGGLYKAQKDQISVFGLRTQYGGGKTTGFALVYDSPEAMKKFEPQYRLIRVGLATKVERASRQQRAYTPCPRAMMMWTRHTDCRTQASSARTARRPSAGQRRSRVPRPRRRNKRIAPYRPALSAVCPTFLRIGSYIYIGEKCKRDRTGPGTGVERGSGKKGKAVGYWTRKQINILSFFFAIVSPSLSFLFPFSAGGGW